VTLYVVDLSIILIHLRNENMNISCCSYGTCAMYLLIIVIRDITFLHDM